MKLAPVVLFCFVFTVGGCRLSSEIRGNSSNPSNGIDLSNKSLNLDQNSGAITELNPDPVKYAGAVAFISQNPTYGTVSISGSQATYTPDPFYSGTDSYSYYLNYNGENSQTATVTINLNGYTSGTYSVSEDFSGQTFNLSNWYSYTSSFGHSSPATQGFDTGTFNSISSDLRHIGVTTAGTEYGGDSLYNSLFSALPVDGAGGAMSDWAWAADILHEPKCFYDVTLDFKLVYASSNVLVSLLLNYKIEETENGQVLTGYQALINGGGNSVTLSRFNQANEHATSFMDRWPNTNSGTEAFTNPVEHGPYKGWNLVKNTWPAGGSVNNAPSNNVYLKARYRYDPISGDTTINYEALHDDGTDDTPGTWDFEKVLSGSDSLPPGGGFGYMPLPYNTPGLTLNSAVKVSDFNLECVVP